MSMPAFEQSTGLILKAVAFAAEKHRDQRRKDPEASPYINHPIALANLLASQGVTSPEVLCAALLHDTIEDTETTEEELAVHFGPRIAGIVLEVTDDTTQDKATRKQAQIDHAPHISPEARLVKLADKICNLRDILTSPPEGWPLERQQEYFDWAARVIDGVRGVHAGLETLFDQVYTRRGELRPCPRS